MRCPKSVPEGRDLWGTMEGNEIVTMLSGKRKALSWPQILKRNKIWAGLIVVIAVIGILAFDYENPAMLRADGEPIAVVSGEEQVKEAIEKLKIDLSKEYNVAIAESKTSLTYEDKLPKGKNKPISDQELYAVLKEKLAWEVNCWSIIINDIPVLHLASEDQAQKAVQGIKDYYVPEQNGQIRIEELKTAEEVTVASGRGFLDQIITPELAVEAMVRGLDKIVQHTVGKGESLWTVARDNNMTVSELMAANPELNEKDYLQPGQKLNLVRSEPLVNVVTTMTTSLEEKIAYSTSYQNDAELWRGQERVIKPGSNGSREVTYRITRSNEEEIKKETLAEKILLEPVSQIVARGTKIMAASRGDGGSGTLSWPTRGKINSPYGKKRGRTIHSGTDIDGETGDPVYAAEAGVILYASYRGTYGNCIDIDHGKGLLTRYGHLSSIGVKVGQQVARGDLIGKLGSTGKSTGPHLHFEVRVNNVPQNPMKYLSQND